MRNPIVYDIIKSLLIGVITFEASVIALVIFSHFSPTRLAPIAALCLVLACVVFIHGDGGGAWLTRRRSATHVKVSHPTSLPPRWSTPASEAVNRHSSRYGLFRVGGMPSTRPAAEGPYRRRLVSVDADGGHPGPSRPDQEQEWAGAATQRPAVGRRGRPLRLG
ncbi:MAG: hypothetical protein F4X30_02660 [Acidimicrobiaceae bacterium]|nr:hypothetical protein [Acidimicrobiaceae bacterium]